MTFKWLGRAYDTSKMSIFETGNPATPVVYVGAGGEVFIVEIERMEGIEVRLAGPDEALLLAERLGFAHLLSAAKPQEPVTALPLVKRRALIVEDDGCSRHALTRLLHCSGYDTTSAATVAEAESKLDDHPAWLILDLQLPDGRGTTLLERVRSENMPTKVAVTTGETNQELLSQVYRLHPDAVFRKPLDMSQIMQWLDAA